MARVASDYSRIAFLFVSLTDTEFTSFFDEESPTFLSLNSGKVLVIALGFDIAGSAYG